MKDNSRRLQIAPPTAGTRFSPKTESTIAWFNRTVESLAARNNELWSEMVFYRSVCRFYTWTIVIAIVVAVVFFFGQSLEVW